ncbi:heparinase II/III domain-containing protein [Arthrobacter sp. 35W]|uniref:heparinase II/III domain-containing protein n=1 Tax=Arthrobacter sp. 35W TaxID=1132441 RepID=UPI00040C7837|nr:heparinase II/III family protein [Arthrobacter sp. 35W]
MTISPGLPPAKDSAWQSVDPRVAATVLHEAERLHAAPAVLPTAGEWMQYGLTGNRIGWESRLTALQDRLSTSALAACLSQDDGETAQWARIAADDAWTLCELTSWCLPAHYPSGAVDNSRELPDADAPVLDLDAGVTGALLAWSASLLAERWQASQPSVLQRVHREVRRRVLAPFTGRTHYWFGSPAAPPNNWAPWITANALACFLVVGTAEEQAAAVETALPVLDNFCAGYGPDGACEEGATYWWVAALTLYEALDFAGALTGAAVDRLAAPLVAAMGKYPHQMQIHEHWQVNFGDASPHIETAVRFHTALRYAAAVGDGDAALFAWSMGSVAGQRDPERWTLPAPSGRNFHRMVLELLDPEWMAPGSPTAPDLPYPAATYLPSTGVLCARERAGSSEGLFLAVKGGDNGVSHNHNDAGSFTVFANGMPVIIDIGVETYRKETFEPDRRYSIWTMRSSFHNVPIINGHEQQPGHAFAATEVDAWGIGHGEPADSTGLSMNLEQAYGDVAGLDSWHRIAHLDRVRAQIRIADSWQGPNVNPEIVLMLAQEPHRISAAGFSVGGAVIGHSDGWEASFERIPVEDALLLPVWGPFVHRAVIRPIPGRQSSGSHELTVSEVGRASSQLTRTDRLLGDLGGR